MLNEHLAYVNDMVMMRYDVRACLELRWRGVYPATSIRAGTRVRTAGTELTVYVINSHPSYQFHFEGAQVCINLINTLDTHQ